MKVEVLFPEYCNLYGDYYNVEYLKRCLPDADFIETPLDGEMQFLRGDVSLVYMGPMTERLQEKVIEKLMPHRDAINEQIQAGKVFLFTGNAFETLGHYIEGDDGARVAALDLLPFYAKYKFQDRHNSIFLGTFNNMEITGFKSQFSMCYPDASAYGLIQVIKGTGLNPKCSLEGVRERNFFGTYLIGPLLVSNPPFTKYLLSLLGEDSVSLAFEDAVTSAYQKRLSDIKEKA